MACSSMSIYGSSIATSTKDILKEQNGVGLRGRSGIGRTMSESHLRLRSVNRIRAASVEPKLRKSRSMGIFPTHLLGSNSSRPLLSDAMGEEMTSVGSPEVGIELGERESEMEKEKKANWVERLLELRGRWRNRQPKEQMDEEEGEGDGNGDKGGCEVDYSSDGEEEQRRSFDQESFSRLLVRVSWSDTKQFSQLAFLSNLAYGIEDIKAEDLRKSYNLHYVTSSLEKKANVASNKVKLDHDHARMETDSASNSDPSSKKGTEFKHKQSISSSITYEVAASAASYIHSHSKGLLSLGLESCPEDVKMEPCGERDDILDGGFFTPIYNYEVAAYMVTSTMTAVVAAEEEAKQEAARELQSLHSSPCEWFICDDPSTYTRCFIIQGSDSLASWQANLFFEPTKFEGTDVAVHRGIYEAAKGIYKQFMPEILKHLKRYGERAKLRFTGHSLGGSLSLLVSLMLLARGVINPSFLLPVVTFGSPSIFCGGQRILDKLGLNESHVHSVIMHRDIVPRAFSCNYPTRAVQILKRLNGSFRSHPCLNKHKLLYSPMGQLYILQPDDKLSPPHPLLPPGSALYALDKTRCESQAEMTSALRAFLNSPHPLETLSEPKAYGSEGTIHRDHTSSNYIRVLNWVLWQHTKLAVRQTRRQRLHDLWPVLATSPSDQPWSHGGYLNNHRLVIKEVVADV
ncbi:phospholipase A1 PLIP1, chloroplastic [Macadamia integrifolia]|uniref:phospholipase A1 PLIP1, chloroplastic n=1 Tax=Macadamia integrifolia TaxID=60698 RepID=UPI001C4FE57E|nr:phospholipase A1 PLIP1, chloroplastic [Macadamia integrifolia]XP_042504087.1 phospholipase A1 PLIP1, chloroplastic [Macadamia integrifolia]XP_042504088.1 phospholipase A1 PLIP1, chloroplastic [Macadamia integrifolia]XP_042504089.1 phospholipase A1 PLIP1, chloroplastic [Macadamia integrifolia]